MRTTSASNLFNSIAAIYGEDSLTATDRAFCGSVMDTEHLTEAWSFANWRELDVIEQRYFADAYSSTTAYVTGDTVYESTEDVYYMAVADNVGTPLNDSNFWSPSSPGSAFPAIVPFVQAGKTAIGQVAGVTLENPQLCPGASEVAFVRRPNAVQIVSANQNYVYIRFTRRKPQLTGKSYETITSYDIDDVVYDPKTGECYESLQADNKGNAVTDAAFWQVQPIPYFLQPYLIRACLSSLYESKDKEQRADRNRELAMDKLSAAYHVQHALEGQQEAARVLTASQSTAYSTGQSSGTGAAAPDASVTDSLWENTGTGEITPAELATAVGTLWETLVAGEITPAVSTTNVDTLWENVGLSEITPAA